MSDDRTAHGTCFAPRRIRWIAIATAVHVVVLVALLVVSRRPSPEARRAEDVGETATEIEVMVGVERSGEGAVGETVRQGGGVKAAKAEKLERRAGTGTGTGTSRGGVGADEVAGAGEVDEVGGAGTGGVVAVPLTAEQLGIGGRNPFLPRAEEKAPDGADHPAARAMRGTGLAHDRELGLGPEGPAITALSDATTSSIAPLRGRALFIVRTGGDGLVSAIELLDSDGGAGWMDAGRIALERLRGKKLTVPRGASAMNMRIEVRSDMKLPNGESAPVTGRLGDNNMPELTIPDLSNLGARPRRVVHARAVGTDLL